MEPRRLGLALAALIALVVLVAAQAAGAGSTSKLTILYVREDAFRNYDFLSQTVSSTNVDWPVNFLFWNNAEIDKVKSKLGGYYPYSGSKMNGRLNDGSGFVWDQDGGRKSILCPIIGDAYHYRIYADSDDRMYNISWGYWVFGTSHIDHNECGFGKWFGKSEQAENHIASHARNVFGSSNVAEDWSSFYNYEPYREQGNHIWQNNGYATAVRVP
jgi:hypothetical protein